MVGLMESQHDYLFKGTPLNPTNDLIGERVLDSSSSPYDFSPGMDS